MKRFNANISGAGQAGLSLAEPSAGARKKVGRRLCRSIPARALLTNLPNYAAGIVSTREVVDSVSFVRAIGMTA